MSRAKGRTSRRVIHRDYPYFVRVEIPRHGLGTILLAMHDFAARFGYATDSDTFAYTDWRFATTEAAEAFRAEFPPERLEANAAEQEIRVSGTASKR